MQAPATLERLMRRSAEQCDGAWEHSRGVRIDTLDTPGWRIRIDMVRRFLDMVGA